ncbi:unnamed protein product [Sphagnum jensenii]|uniref:DUF4283 domain-containing protein n=1 Tax=Sphagnum jensenii TaxID=128206 RepID=A0ABP1A7Y5_9BRYO
MGKMETCSDLDEKHISKLNEYSLVALRIQKAGRGTRLGFGKFKCRKPNLGSNVGAKAHRPESTEVPSATNGSFEASAHDHCKSLPAQSSPSPGSSANPRETIAGLASTDPTALSESRNTQAPSRSAETASTRSSEESREGTPWRPPSPIKLRKDSTRSAKIAVGEPGSSSLAQVPPKALSIPSSFVNSLQNALGQGGVSGILSNSVGKHVASEKLPAIKEKNSGESSDPGKGSNTNKNTTPSLILITHTSKGLGKNAPQGAKLQGPSPVDQGLEIEAEFPHDMVSKIQNNVATKARRMVISRTLGGRPSFKALHKCLKLHLPATYVSTTLLTRGYFLIAFENEEGAIATRKLTTVDWSGLSLSFSRFSSDFNSSAQGAEALLTHSIKVQFPDLHEQFRNVKALTIMASKLGTVLEIEAAESYIKRSASPMVTMEVRDITRLVGFIRIPSMAEGAPTTNSVRQRILYSGLLNQCRKWQNFRHHAWACTVFVTRQRESFVQPIPPRGDNKGRDKEANGVKQSANRAWGTRPQAPPDPRGKKGEGARVEDKGTRPLPPPPQVHPQPSRRTPPRTDSSELGCNLRKPPGNELRDLEMPDLRKSPIRQKDMTHPSSELGKVSANAPNSKL